MRKKHFQVAASAFGKMGGKARAKKLSAERRREIAKLGYAAGLGKKKKQARKK